MGKIRALGAAIALWAFVGSGLAAADEGEADRLAKLEALLRQQAEQLERMQSELRALKAAGGTEGVVAPQPAPAPAAARAAPPPASVSAPFDPYAPVAFRDRRLDDKLVQSATEGALFSRKGLSLSGIRWGGYLTVEYIANSEKNSFIDLHRFILDAQAQISDCIDMKCEIEIEHGGAADKFDGEVVIEHMDVVFRMADCFNPKVGALLIPMARFNKYHDDPYNDFTKRPWTARYLVPTGFGQPGIGVEGIFNAGPNTRLGYDVVLTHGYKDEFTAKDGTRKARQFWKSDNNEGKQVWGRLSYLTNNKTLDFFEAGLSGTWGRYDDADENDLFGYAVDLTARKGPLELHFEWVRMDYDRNAMDPVDAIRGQDALWAELGYHFFPTFMCGCRNCIVQPTSHFTLAFRYQVMDLDDNRTGAHFNDDLTGYGVALNYRITESSVFRIDHTWLDAKRESDQRELTLSFSTFF
ncbi:MAG: hypothetical protein QNJ98_17305 [Planctomycetota bacterium]|nr:hypothetical protein [Planctomycetota bacterium]